LFKNEISNPIFQNETSNTETGVDVDPWFKVTQKVVAYPLPRIKKLYKDTIVPKKGSEEAAGYDLYAHIPEHTIEIRPGECKLIGTGVAITPPTGYCAFIMARSGLATKQGLRPANCVGR
jgi:dUTPase